MVAKKAKNAVKNSKSTARKTRVKKQPSLAKATPPITSINTKSKLTSLQQILGGFGLAFGFLGAVSFIYSLQINPLLVNDLFGNIVAILVILLNLVYGWRLTINKQDLRGPEWFFYGIAFLLNFSFVLGALLFLVY